MSLKEQLVTLEMIQAARSRLQGVALHTGLAFTNSVSDLSHAKVYLKMENLQRTGSFKLRGAYNKIASLTDEEREKGIIASSAGNHAQGVALAANAYGINSTICMPKHAPFSKVMATRSYGADVVLYGNFYDETYARALELQKEHGYTFCHPFNDPLVIAGQGTIALEILEDMPDTDVIVVPIGGGGLISGIAVAAKSMNPKIKIIGVQTKNMPSMQESIANGKIMTVDGSSSIADGITVKTPGDITFDIVQHYVDDIITVDEAEIAGAVLLLLERGKTVAEGAGAVPVAALINEKISGCRNKKVAAMISGGNIDVNMMTRIINNGLVQSWRKVFLDTIVPDQPGALYLLLQIISESGANVLAVTHDRAQRDVEIGFSHVSLELETANEKHVHNLMRVLKQKRYDVSVK